MDTFFLTYFFYFLFAIAVHSTVHLDSCRDKTRSVALQQAAVFVFCTSGTSLLRLLDPRQWFDINAVAVGVQGCNQFALVV